MYYLKCIDDIFTIQYLLLDIKNQVPIQFYSQDINNSKVPLFWPDLGLKFGKFCTIMTSLMLTYGSLFTFIISILKAR